MFDSKWVYKSEQRISTDIISEILNMRGISEQESYLNPCVDNLLDPFLINDMDKAVNRINIAIDNNEKICIYGDYDADGLTSAAILIRFFRELGLEPGYFIPDRFDDGYGLSTDSLERLVQDDYTLVITTDCGINSINEANFLKNCNVDLIITDHHRSLGAFPSAKAVICCTRSDNTYPYLNLSGAGIAYKVTKAVSISRQITKADKNIMILAALGTVADIVPLDGENRIIVKEGIKLIKKGLSIGIRAILEYASVKEKIVDSSTLGFVVGPRINAAGRMGEAYQALELLITDDYNQAREFAGHLDLLNRKRKGEQDRVFKKVLKVIDKNPDIYRRPVILAGDENCNKGVIGIVASKISELYKKPSIIYTLNGEIGEASGRSFGKFSLINALKYCNDLLISYGGHTNAAGLSFPKDSIALIRKKLDDYASEIGFSRTENITEIDFQVYPDELDLKLAEKFKSLKPFGNGNPQPIFSLKNVVLKEYRKIGSNGLHLKLIFKSDERYFNGISFNTAFYEPLLFLEEKYDIAFYADINDYRGEKNLQLRLVDINFSEKSSYYIDILIVRLLVHMIKYEKSISSKTNSEKIVGMFYKKGMPSAAERLISEPGAMNLNRDYTAGVYRKLKHFKSGEIVDITGIFAPSELAKSAATLEILIELGILKYSPEGMYTYRVVDTDSRTKKQLESSLIYKILREKEE